MDDLSPMKNLLGGAMDRAGIKSQLHSTRVVQAANDVIVKLLPESCENDARAISFRKGILSIETLTSSASHFLGSKQEDLIRKISDQVPQTNIAKIRFRVVKNFPSDL